MRIGAIVLAAGASTRFGRPKQIEPLAGSPLLGIVLGRVRSWPVARIWLVLGAHADKIRQQVDTDGVEVVVNPDWEEGMASSMRRGLEQAETSDVDAVFVVLGDQPDIAGEAVAALTTAGRPDRAAVPVYRGIRSNPALIGRELWPAVRELQGDVGARYFLADNPELVVEVPIDSEPPADIDTEEDLWQPGRG